MKKELIGIITCTLLISVAVASSTAVVSNIKNMTNNELVSNHVKSGKTVYVDDDNTEGPWDGTIEHPYQYIQDGIDNANLNDTVYVFKGLYDRIRVNKTIQLVGEDVDETIIAYSDCPVVIDADWISIKKFTIKAEILCISMSSHHNNHITSNILTSISSSVNKGRLPRCGIALGSSTHNIISDNIIEDRGQGIIFQGSSDNTISGNIVTNCGVGIVFEYGCNNNIIVRNEISNIGNYGIWITQSSDNNLIYHNNFIDNNPNAYDECTNIWDDDYPSGGNYWDDYTGVDEDEDGIGDTPYPIPGGDNEDRYPLMEPWENQLPDAPTIDGPTSGKVRVEYEYNFSLSDPDDDSMYLRVDWGNGTPGPWQGPYDSDITVKLSHTWNQKGAFTIRAQAKDIYDAESEWGTIDVTMPKNKPFNFPLISWFLERFTNCFPLLEQLPNLQLVKTNK